VIRISDIQLMIVSFPVIGTAATPAAGPLAALLGGYRRPS
jgi:hypothetical protein